MLPDTGWWFTALDWFGWFVIAAIVVGCLWLFKKLIDEYKDQ